MEPLASSAGPLVGGTERGVHFLKIVKNVHQDDIHCVASLADKTFVTGSKDGSIKKWNRDGTLVRLIVDPKKIDYTKWVTAIAPFDGENWLSGTREGKAYLWNNAGTASIDMLTKHAPLPSKKNPKCKARNAHRINCLAGFTAQSKKAFFFAGWATQFSLHDATTCKRLRCTYTSENDWVYAIQPLTPEALLVVTGCRLEVWGLKKGTYDWEMQNSLIAENRKLPQRPYISAITPLLNSAEKFGLAVFDGSVRVCDLEKKSIVFWGQEHIERVWTIENIARDCFASCGDDGFVKLWDVRSPPKSLWSLKGNEHAKARVSILLNNGEHQLIGGSCPDDVKRSHDKAQFTFWDIRYI